MQRAADKKASPSDEDVEPASKAPGRSDELSGKKKVREQVLDVMKDVEKGFTDQTERGNDSLDYWDIYDCKLGANQFYNGNSKIFIPIVHTAINARKTRFTNQIFPRSGRNVEVTTSEEKPYSFMALMEHYIRRTKLRTQVVPALMKNGDVEGQYTLYIGWQKIERNVAYRSREPVAVDIGDEALNVEDEDVETVKEDKLEIGGPTVEVIADCDVLVLPHTADSIEEAIQNGGSVTVIRRWTKAKIEQALTDKEVDNDPGKALLKDMAKAVDQTQANAEKKHVDAAGIHGEGTKHAVVYETWTRLKVNGETRICRVYYAGRDRVLSVKLNPYWCDRVPVLSCPVEKVAGSFKGQSKVKFCADMQYAANDAVNEGADSAAYALLPIIMTDPERNPRVGSMILNLAAIWETDPKSTQFAQFPPLWKDALTLVGAYKNEIQQQLAVSPAMIAQSTGSKNKRNQAEIANEQQVDILSTADVVINLEEEILTPLLQWFAWMDHQFRDDEITVRQFGNMGLKVTMETVPVLQADSRFEFRWFGVEAARNAQQIQTQIAAMNVIRGIPPQQYQGYTLNLVPVLTQLVENAFGSRLAPEIFQDMKQKLGIDPERENAMLAEGFDMPVHLMDEDQAHMQAHMPLLQAGDSTGNIRKHMLQHSAQMQLKGAQQMQQQGQQGAPGGAGPGVAGTPKPGAQPMAPRGGQQPPGAIHQDRMHDPAQMPRRM